MNKLEKGLQILMILAVVLLIVIFIVTIMVGHATDYRFIFSTQDFSNIISATLSNGKLM